MQRRADRCLLGIVIVLAALVAQVCGATNDIKSNGKIGQEKNYSIGARVLNAELSINDGAAKTTFQRVKISLSVEDENPIVAYYLSEIANTPSIFARGWTEISSTQNIQIDVSFDLSYSNGIKTIYAWFKNEDGQVSSVISETIIVTDLPKRPKLGSNWMFFGDSETTGRAREKSVKSQVVAYTNIWNKTYDDNQSPVIRSSSGWVLAKTYTSYKSRRNRDIATWVHFQESGYQNFSQDTAEKFIAVFEKFVRAIVRDSPRAIISTETAYSFEAEQSPRRDWTEYNTLVRKKIDELSDEGITVYLSEVDKNINALVAEKKALMGQIKGQQTVWGDINNDIGRHYTGLGNLMVALSVYDSLGFDVDILDLSAISNSEVSTTDKKLCLDIIRQQKERGE